MELAKKFALVPYDQVSKHTPVEKHMSDLDVEMTKILKSSLDEYEKVQKYYEILQRKMKLENFNLPWKKNEDSTEPANISPDEENKSSASIKKQEYDTLILNTVPQNRQKQASHLLQIVKEHPHMLSWNEKGEISIRNKKMENSNIADLFHLLFTNKKKPVKAQKEFLNTLYEMNVPKHFLKNRYLSFTDLTPSKHSSEIKMKNVKWEPY